jgi:hypothetical protein
MAACLHSYRFLDMDAIRVLMDYLSISSLGLLGSYLESRWEP